MHAYRRLTQRRLADLNSRPTHSVKRRIPPAPYRRPTRKWQKQSLPPSTKVVHFVEQLAQSRTAAPVVGTSCYPSKEGIGVVHARLFLFTALALVIAQLQCAGACSGLWCTADSQMQSTPPCHRHQGGASDPSPASCQHAVVAAEPRTFEYSPVSIPLFLPIHLAAHVSVMTPVQDRAGVLSTTLFAPPGRLALASVILRV